MRQLAPEFSRRPASKDRRVAALDSKIAELLAEHDNPLADLHGAGTNLAATIIAQAGDVRRFREAAAFARFCGAAPIPCGSGQTAGRHRLHRGGNRQLNAAYTESRSSNNATTPPPRPTSPANSPKARLPAKRDAPSNAHLANVLYRPLHTWADNNPAMNLLT